MALCGWIRYGKSRRWVWPVVFLVRSLAITRQPLSFRVYVCQPLHRRSISITFIETLGRCPRRWNITPTSGMADASKEGYSQPALPDTVCHRPQASVTRCYDGEARAGWPSKTCPHEHGRQPCCKSPRRLNAYLAFRTRCVLYCLTHCLGASLQEQHSDDSELSTPSPVLGPRKLTSLSKYPSPGTQFSSFHER
ncbi:hypothetical protein B0J12DRAFT_411710 [Macrophomina phaseolina]|uniref:Secreted protein n=1 Tax=Macrophomina phaseolina TaxID=35725 RepID=A0ABQ8GM80_9PEZI|nr:hypothetical protein B0J12DRAFT_411710 [Macrophomina phaseolina]